jgi:phosphoribosylaminoimidazole-succinocarboxamide synthase
MSISIWRNYKKNEGADVGKELLNLLEDKDRMTDLVAQMIEDGEWEIRATRPFQDPGAKTKKERMQKHLESARTMIRKNCGGAGK